MTSSLSTICPYLFQGQAAPQKGWLPQNGTFTKGFGTIFFCWPTLWCPRVPPTQWANPTQLHPNFYSNRSSKITHLRQHEGYHHRGLMSYIMHPCSSQFCNYKKWWTCHEPKHALVSKNPNNTENKKIQHTDECAWLMRAASYIKYRHSIKLTWMNLWVTDK